MTEELDQLDLRYLKELWYDLYYSNNTKVLDLTVMRLSDEFNFDCGEYITKWSVLNHITSVIKDFSRSSDSYYDEGPKPYQFIV